MADVCDQDELATGERREGTYSAVFWWIVKLGLSSSLVLSGVLLKVTGFQEKAGADQSADTFFWMRVCDVAFPAIFIAVAIYLIYRFPLTERAGLRDQKRVGATQGRATGLSRSYTLKRNSMTSPSWTVSSLPSMRRRSAVVPA